MMVYIHVHILILTHLLVSLQVSADDFADLFLGGSITGETYLFVGEDLQLNCSLSDSTMQTYTAHNITFKFEHKAQGEFKCIPQSHVSVVNSQVAMLVIQNVTSQNEGPYACYVGSTDCKDGDNSNLEYVNVSGDVSVEYAPHNVTNFHCEIYNWDEYMICTWQHPVNYVNWSNIEVAVEYMLSGDPRSAYKCPLTSKDNCTWDRENVYLGKNYYIQVAVKNQENNATASKVFVVNTSKIVKPAPVKNFTIAASKEKSGCLVLSWSHSDKYNEKEYRIKNDSKILQNITVTDFTTCGYLPYTSHNFSVECQPTVLYSGYWSEPVYASILTPMTAPEFGPQATNGSFMSADCVDGRSRSVTLMWQDVKAQVRNGLIDYYLIKIKNGKSINVSADMHTANVQLPCSLPSQVEIFAHNEGGYSLEPTVLHIPPVTFTVPVELQETFSVNVTRTTDPTKHYASSNETYRAMWHASDRTRNMNYTVFWCTGSPGKPCKGPIQWSNVIPGTDTAYDIDLQDSDVEKYIFGISVTDTETGMSSGIFWTMCIFSHNPFTSHPKAVKDLKVEADVEKAKIVWSKIQCTYQSLTKVTGYKVKWCKIGRWNDTDEVTLMDVPATENMYTVSALTADVTYSFTVQPVSYEDVGDEVEPWVNVVPTVSEDKSWIATVLVTVVVIVAVTLLGVVLYRVCNARRAKIKQMESSLFPKLTAADSTAPTQETSFIQHLDTRRQATVRLLSIHSSNSLSEHGCDSRSGSPHHFQEMPTILPQNPADPELLPSHSVSAQSYQHITRPPPDQLSQPRNEHHIEDDRMCQISASPDSGPAQLTLSQHSQSSDLTHQDQESKPPSSGSIGSYQQVGNSLSSSSAEPKNVFCQDERTDQGLGLSNSGSLQSYHQIGNCPSGLSPEPKDVFCQDERTDQGLGLSNSEPFQPYHQVAYCESNQPNMFNDANNQHMRVPFNSGPLQTDLSSILGYTDAYSPDTVIPSHYKTVSHLQYDNGNPANKTINQSHYTGTCENVESHKRQPALTAGDHGIAMPTTHGASAQQDHTTVDMDPSLTAEPEVNGSDAAPSDMSLSDVDAVLPEMQSHTDYVSHM
ncbi:hypothetical protein BsWGS_03112 [Bradybaena similaris]